jgi:hypothetical protein
MKPLVGYIVFRVAVQECVWGGGET